MARKKSLAENIMNHAAASFENSYPLPDPEAEAPAPKNKPSKTKKASLAPAYEASKEEAKQAQSISVTYTEATVPAEPVTIPVTRREAQSAEPITVMATRKDAASKDGKPKKDGKTFGVWLQQSTIDRIDAYTEASGRKKTDWVTAALTEYMNRHKLTEDQKKAYQKKQKQKAALDL